MPDMSSTFIGVELKTWIICGAIVLLVAIAHTGLGWWTRRRARKHQGSQLASGESAKARHWAARGLSDAVPPIAFMLWLHGLYFAASMLLADFPPTSWIERGIVILDWVRGVGTLLGLAWLLARIARTLEAFLQSLATRTEAAWDDVLLPFAGRALRLILPIVMYLFVNGFGN